MEVNDLILHEEDVDDNSTRNGHFDKVISVTVENELGSTKSSIENLQKEIAEKLQINPHKENGSRANDAMASALAKLRFLIVYNDMRTELSLEEIDIPSQTKRIYARL